MRRTNVSDFLPQSVLLFLLVSYVYICSRFFYCSAHALSTVHCDNSRIYPHFFPIVKTNKTPHNQNMRHKFSMAESYKNNEQTTGNNNKFEP